MSGFPEMPTALCWYYAFVWKGRKKPIKILLSNWPSFASKKWIIKTERVKRVFCLQSRKGSIFSDLRMHNRAWPWAYWHLYLDLNKLLRCLFSQWTCTALKMIIKTPTGLLFIYLKQRIQIQCTLYLFYTIYVPGYQCCSIIKYSCPWIRVHNMPQRTHPGPQKAICFWVSNDSSLQTQGREVLTLSFQQIMLVFI